MPYNSLKARHGIFAVLVITLGLLVVQLRTTTPPHVLAAPDDLPPGIVHGATFRVPRGLAGSGQYKVQEIRGHWVKANMVPLPPAGEGMAASSVEPGKGREVWINLDATQLLIVEN
jgi:hypothetical protein